MSDLPQFPLPDSERPPRPQLPSAGGYGQVPQRFPPPQLEGPPTIPAHVSARRRKIMVIVGAMIVVLGALAGGVTLMLRRKTGLNEDAIVRVVTGDARGTGFFI